MNLYEQIQHELDSKSWNYYNMKVGDVLKNTKRSRDFIARYFCEGDKKLVIDSWQRDISKTMLDRSVHAVNVFFIGIILQKMVQLQQEKLKLMVKNYTLIILGVFRPKEGLLKTVNSMTKILVN